MLCLRCGRHDISDARTGFCGACASEALLERSNERHAAAARERRDRWHRELKRAEYLNKRVWAALRPRERPSPHVAPGELAADAIEHLNRVRQVLGKSDTAAREHLEAASELVRQLAVGPDVDDGTLTPSQLCEVAGIKPDQLRYLIYKSGRVPYVNPVPGSLRHFGPEVVAAVVRIAAEWNGHAIKPAPSANGRRIAQSGMDRASATG
jgi:hypothetical protein